MSFSHLSLVLRLPLAAILCWLLVFLGGDIPRGDYYASSVEEVVVFEERDDDWSFYVDLPVSFFEDALIQSSEPILKGFGYQLQGIAPDLHATGPPTV